MLTANVIVKENSFEFINDTKGAVFVVANQDISQKIADNYFNSFELKPFNSLKKAIEISLEKDIVAMSYVDGIVYFSSYGACEITLVRNSESRTILSPNEGLQSASGYPKDGDVINLKTQNGKISLRFENKSSFSFNIPVKFNKKIYLKSPINDEVSPQSKRLTFFVALTLLILLFVGVAFGIRQKRNKDLKIQYQGILTEAQTNLDQAISLASDNPEKSRELFSVAESDLQKIDLLKVTDPKVNELRDKLVSSRESILGEYKVDSNLFLDLSLLSSGFNGDEVSSTGGNLYILDKNGKKVVKIDISTKKSKVVAGPTVIDNVSDLASYEDSVYILENDGIYEVDSGKKKVIDSSWQGDAFIRVFGGNMYVLDKNANTINRYSGIPLGFAEKQNWLSASTQVNFKDAKMWGIDGAVYVLYPNSKILKYSQGAPQSFRLSGITPEIGNTDAIYADPDNSYIYLLDKAGKRVVVTDKKGTYKAQYIDDKIGDAINLAVSEKDKKIILLTGEKLLQIDIKNQ